MPVYQKLLPKIIQRKQCECSSGLKKVGMVASEGERICLLKVNSSALIMVSGGISPAVQKCREVSHL